MVRLPGQIDIVAVGKLKTRHWLTAQRDYTKRLTHYGRFALHEVKDVVGRGIPDTVALEREGEALLTKASDANRLILLTPSGKLHSSEDLAQFIYSQSERYGRVAYLLGGPLGFSAQLYDTAHEQIGLSPLTFTHEIARILFLEQLYRACTILNKESYHK